MGAPKRGFQNEESCSKTPTEHRTKTDEPWQVRSYSWLFAIATWKVLWRARSRNDKGLISETPAIVWCPFS
jgi:hypothetical protein